MDLGDIWRLLMWPTSARTCATPAIDVPFTKNSGGPLSEGKLGAARDLGIPVVMVSRPEVAAAESVTEVSDAVRPIQSHARQTDEP